MLRIWTMPVVIGALFWGGLACAMQAQPSEEQLREIEQRLEENTRTAEQIEAEKKRREIELNGLRARLIETADSLKSAETQATDLERRIADLTADEIIVRGTLAVRQQALSETLAALQSLERARPPALAVSPDDAAEAARAAMALATAAPELADQAERLRLEIDRLDQLQTELDMQKNQLRAVERELAARRTVLEELLSQKEEENALAQRRAAALRAENLRLEQQASTIRELLQEIETTALAAATPERPPIPRPNPVTIPDATSGDSLLDRRPELAVYANLPSLFSKAKGKLPLPVSGIISAPYDSVANDGSTLEGVRLQTRNGAVVTASFPGEIVYAGQIGRLGNIALLDVGEDYHLVFIGLGRLEVKKGDNMSAGEVIGYMPQNGPRQELEFQIRRKQAPQNPEPWLRKTQTG